MSLLTGLHSDRRRQGVALLALACVIAAVTLGVGAATAPSVEQRGAGDRATLVGSQGGGPGWHKYGSVYLLRGTERAWTVDRADSYFDVTARSGTPKNGVLSGFMDTGRSECGPYESPCARTGFEIVYPNGTVREGYDFPVRTSKNSEVHDVERLPGGEYLLTDMDRERIFTVRNGSVTWQWNASSFYDAPPDPTRTDWLHINDVDVIGEQRFLVSVRNANQLLVISRGEGVTQVINADRSDENDGNCGKRGQLRDTDGDGDIRCGDPSVLNHQHNPQWLGENAVLVADSDNDRVVELRRRNGSWQPVWSLSSAGGIPFDWPRDADRLPNGNTLVTDTLNKRIVEIAPNGSVVWSVSTRRIPYEADRLPTGEMVGGPMSDSGSVDSPENELPVIGLLLIGVRAVVPAVPFWFGGVELVALLCSFGIGIAGAVQIFRGLRSPNR
jgi:hypothetical protein